MKPIKAMVNPSGFTLIELMVVVAIIGILAAVAVPAYTDYVIRGKIPDATSALASKRVQVEQFFQDNRTYLGANGAGLPCAADSATSRYFDFSCPVLTASTFTLTATGKASMLNFAYTITQDNTKGTTITAANWAGSSTTCWITKKGESC